MLHHCPHLALKPVKLSKLSWVTHLAQQKVKHGLDGKLGIFFLVELGTWMSLDRIWVYLVKTWLARPKLGQNLRDITRAYFYFIYCIYSYRSFTFWFSEDSSLLIINSAQNPSELRCVSELLDCGPQSLSKQSWEPPLSFFLSFFKRSFLFSSLFSNCYARIARSFFIRFTLVRPQ